jgi:hypothetical protein
MSLQKFSKFHNNPKYRSPLTQSKKKKKTQTLSLNFSQTYLEFAKLKNQKTSKKIFKTQKENPCQPANT